MEMPENVDAYIKNYPKEIQQSLEQVRKAIKKAVPLAEEVICYGIRKHRGSRHSKRTSLFIKEPKVQFNFLLISHFQ